MRGRTGIDPRHVEGANRRMEIDALRPSLASFLVVKFR
jgi:hypothetical protein